MFCRKFRWPSMKVLQIKYADLSCSDVHWSFWRMFNALRLGSEVCNWYRLAISPIWRRRSTIKFYSQSAVCILPSVCILPLVCSLQSAVRSLPFTLTGLANSLFKWRLSDFLSGPFGLLSSRNFATMATWSNDFSSLLSKCVLSTFQASGNC